MCLTPSQQKVKTWTRSRSEMPCTVNGFQCHIETSPRRQDLGTTGAPGKIETWIRATYIGIRIYHLSLYEYIFICMYVWKCRLPLCTLYSCFNGGQRPLGSIPKQTRPHLRHPQGWFHPNHPIPHITRNEQLRSTMMTSEQTEERSHCGVILH